MPSPFERSDPCLGSQLFQELRDAQRVPFDARAYTNAVQACEQVMNLDLARRLFDDMKVSPADRMCAATGR